MFKLKLLHIFLFLFLISFNTFSQIVIDDFSDSDMLGWVPGSSKFDLEHLPDGSMLVTGEGVGPNYEGFGKMFSALDMSKFTKITIRVKVPDTVEIPSIRVDVTDNNGYDSNWRPVVIKPDNNGEFATYTLDYTNKLKSSWPSSNVLDSKKIVRMYFFVNPAGKAWTGSFIIDDIVLEGAQKPVILGKNADWKYFSGDTEPNNWESEEYDDSNWLTGTTPMGYGLSGLNTEISNTATTSYFRKELYVSDTSAYSTLVVNSTSGEGVVLYINGEEVYRNNLPEGVIDASTEASSAYSANEFNEVKRTVVPITPLDSGINIIAAEVHRHSSNEEMLRFDLDITASVYDFGVIRGPYLQTGTDTSIVIKWRTLEETGTTVNLGTAPDNLNTTIDSTGRTTEHEVLVTGLQPSTKYYYSIGYGDHVLKGGDEEHYFITSPEKGTQQPIRLWAIGDAGKSNNDQRAVRDAYYTYTEGRHTDAFLILGDNAYNDGFDDEYQASMFENMFENLMNKTVCWPTPGNHDLGYHIEMDTLAPYFDIFTVPVNGEAGGVPSGTESYYSYTYGNIHFISLDSHGTPRDSVEAMAQWLKEDLKNNDEDWLIAYWHHPPYTKGSHDSDDDEDSDGRLKEMREQILPILERHGVDLILTGHSHVYERSYMIHGHYDYSNTFLDAPHIVNEISSGNPEEGDPYYKNPEDATYPNIGTVYPVLGCSGLKSDDAAWEDQPDNLLSSALMYTYTNEDLGSLVIDVHRDTLNAKFLTSKGKVKDNFTIIKDKEKSIVLVKGEPNVGITDGLYTENNVLKVYPNPSIESINLDYTIKERSKVLLEVFDPEGKKVETLVDKKQGAGEYNYKYHTSQSGIFIVKLTIGKDTYSRKVLIKN